MSFLSVLKVLQNRKRRPGQAKAPLRLSGCTQAAERSLTELKEFASQLKALPNIQRHISLAEAVNKAIAAPAFRAHVGAEQAMLDGQSADAAAEAIEVKRDCCAAVTHAHDKPATDPLPLLSGGHIPYPAPHNSEHHGPQRPPAL